MSDSGHIKSPNEVTITVKHISKNMLWCAIFFIGIIGFCLLREDTVKGDSDNQILHYYVLPKLQQYPNGLIFLQDRAPLHFSVSVIKYLSDNLPHAWISRGRPIPWPAKFPDITPYDSFLWGYIKDKICTSCIRDV